MSKWTENEVQQLIQLRTIECWTVPAIAAMIGRSRYGVEAKLERLGIYLPSHVTRGKSIRKQSNLDTAVHEAFKQGIHLKRVASELRISPQTVSNAYRQYANEGAEQTPHYIVPGTYIGGREMIRIVAPILGVTPQAILSSGRVRPLVLARIAVAKALRDRGLSLPVVASALGRSDHSTAFNWIAKFDTYAAHYPRMLKAYGAIKLAERIAAEELAA